MSSVSTKLSLPLSATHRLLTALCEAGYIKQSREQGDYFLTMKLVSLGLGFLSNAGVVDIAQPMLDRLAEESGELVRLGVLDGESLTFVGKAQGATRGPAIRPRYGLVGQALVQRRGPRVARDPDRRGSAALSSGARASESRRILDRMRQRLRKPCWLTCDPPANAGSA